MQVLAVTPEIFPLIKTGGLADVTGALPVALARQGVATRTLIPGYPQVMKAVEKSAPLRRYPSLHGGKVTILAATVAGLDLLVLDAPHLFDRAGRTVRRLDRRRLARQLAALLRAELRRGGHRGRRDRGLQARRRPCA